MYYVFVTLESILTNCKASLPSQSLVLALFILTTISLQHGGWSPAPGRSSAHPELAASAAVLAARSRPPGPAARATAAAAAQRHGARGSCAEGRGEPAALYLPYTLSLVALRSGCEGPQSSAARTAAAAAAQRSATEHAAAVRNGEVSPLHSARHTHSVSFKDILVVMTIFQCSRFLTERSNVDINVNDYGTPQM